MKFKNTLLAALTCASLLGSAALSQATLIVAEDFTYANGALNGKNGGTGFSAAWTSSTNVTGGVSTGNSDSTRSLTTAFPSTGTLWISFDWGYSVQPSENGSYGGLTFYIGGSEKFLIGNTWPGSGHNFWRMNGSGSAGVSNHPGMKTGVAKITLGAGATSTVELWVGPTGSPVDVSGSPLATASGRELAGVNGLRINGQDFGNGGNSQSFDNLLIGTTMADVDATIPSSNSGTWTNTSGGPWDTASNWLGNVIASGSGNTADFNTLNITADTTVSINSARTIGNLILGDTDTSSAAGWTLAGSALTLAGTTPTITVNALGSTKTATISAAIAGTAGLTKAGTGVITLSGANTYTGPTSLTSGTIELQGAAVSHFRSSTSIASGATLKVTGETTPYAGGNYDGLALGSAATGSATISGAGTLVINHFVGIGNATGAPNISIALESGSLIDIQSGALVNGGWAKATWSANLADMNIASGASFDIWDGNAVTIDSLTGAGTVRNGANDASSNKTLTIGANHGTGTFSGVIGGGMAGGLNAGIDKIAVTKTGSGTQTFSGANTYLGSTTVNGGGLSIAPGGSLRFRPTINGLTNSLSGSASATLSYLGTLDFDLSAADATVGNLWTIVNVSSFSGPAPTLTPAAVTSTLGSFTETSPGIWELPVSGAKWTFTEASGTLTYTGTATEYEAGLTFRLYDIQEAMDQLYPLVPGQTPNVDEKRSTIDWSGSADFAGLTQRYLVECFANLDIVTAGSYEFRLSSDDGSELFIDETLVIDHDGVHAATAVNGSITLSAARHPLRLRFFQEAGDSVLKLEWRPPGASSFVTVPASAYLTTAGVTRVVAPGKKEIITPGDSSRPGSGQPLDAVHPSWRVTTIHPTSFNPKVGAMAVHPTDGRLFISTFEPNGSGYNSGPVPGGDGKIWALTNTQGENPEAVVATEVASGLFEPLGMKFVNGVLHVSERMKTTRLRDTNSDGYFETKDDIGGGWLSANYHHFHFGLIERDGFAYSTLSTSINFNYQGISGPNSPNRGTLVRTNLTTGAVTYLAGGLRTPNGLCFGPEGEIFQTDNQGAWLPASRLNHLQQGKFYGHYNTTADGGSPSLFADQAPSPPALWFPHNEVANSPSEPLSIPDGPFAGDLLIGEITLGGINRVSLEKVRGVWQGCIYRFTQGLEGGVNRLAWGPNGTLYVGCIGGGGNWSWNGTTTGLQRLTPLSGNPVTFEIAKVAATATGFAITYTKPIPEAVLENPANFTVRQWSYQATAEYGGPKIGEETLSVSSATASADRTRVTLVIPGLEEGHVVYLKSDPLADDGSQILSTEAWYTLNEIPNGPLNLQLTGSSIPENQPAATPVGTLSASHDNSGETITFSLPAGLLDNALFSLNGAALSSTASFDYERRSSFQIRVRATDEAGLHTEATFTITISNVAVENAPRRILLTNSVLPPDHQANALVGHLLMDDPDLGDHSEISYPLAFPSYEFVAGAGDANNASFAIVGNRLSASSILAAGLHRIRVRVTESAGLSFAQPLLVWVGAGHLDSNNDGIDDATASRLGFDPLAPMNPGAYFGSSGTSPVFGPGSGPNDFLLTSDTLPGNLYWIESSPDLAQWTLDPQSVVAPMSFLETWNQWALVRPADPRHFWRVGGGWPSAHGTNPLANGLAGLTFIGGNAGWSYDTNTGILRHDTAAPSDWLHFPGEHSDCLLSLDYRLSAGGNSGVFLRAASTGQPWVTGSEVQLTHEPRLPIHSTGAVYDRIPAEPAADASHSVWHRLEILMIAGRIRVKVDGVLTVDEADVRLSHPQFSWPESGLIGLQNSHNPAPGHVEFRNIRIVPLDP